MSYTYIFVILSVVVSLTNGKSLTVVLDTTVSMQKEINFIRSGIGTLLHSISNGTSVENYILVPFNDPDVGPATVHTTVGGFLESFNHLRVSRNPLGGDEPEYSLSGLEKALQESKLESDIFLFTDACAKDEKKFSSIKRLCEKSGSKVFVFMSGQCYNSNGNIKIYYDITKVCSGNMFQMDQLNVIQIVNFMKEIVTVDYNKVTTYEPFFGYRLLEISVDTLTTDLMVSVVGESPTIHMSEERVYSHSPRTDILITNQNSQVERIVHPRRGLYKVGVNTRNMTSVTIYMKNGFPLQIGFSPFPPGSMEETSSKPLPGETSFIFVLVPRSYKYQLTSLTIFKLNEEGDKTMSLSESRVGANIYITQAYFEHDCRFKISVSGKDEVTSEPISMMSKSYETQTEAMNVPWSAAYIESIIPAYNLIHYKTTARVACKVTGCPLPTIWWEDETGQKINSQGHLLQYPATYISYVELENFVENTTITCKARTSTGEDSRKVDLYVYRPYNFKMVRTPTDTTIEYETEGKLYCEVDAYPDPTITWYFNEKQIQFSSNDIYDDDKYNVEYFKEDNALVIRNMTSVYVGTYRCDARNEANYKTFSAEVKISGLESPKIDMETELTSKVGEEVEISCRVMKGKPNPKITWKYKSVDDYDYTDLPDDVKVENDKVVISDIKSKHKGIYKCEAINEKGEASRDVNVKVIYAPQIEDAELPTKVVEVVIYNWSVLECKVDAEPQATVRWERSDLRDFLDEEHIVDGNNLRFKAQLNDSGVYRCIAENEAGTAEKSFNVDVTVRPVIAPFLDSVNVRTGNTLRLPCRIPRANPAPTIKWMHISSGGVASTLKAIDQELIIPRVTKADAGTYKCFSENKVGQDHIEIIVHVD